MFYPFTLPGPAFLVFYLQFLGVVVLGYGVLVWRASRGAAGTTGLGELAANPYEVAWLRGGRRELIDIAIFNLVDRGLLRSGKQYVELARQRGADYARQPLDKAILARCATPTQPASLAANPPIRALADGYASVLRNKGLCIDEEARRSLNRALLSALALVLGLAGARLVQALLRAQSNVGGLILGTVIAVVLLLWLGRVRTTSAGREALRSLRALVERKRAAARLQPGGTTTEAVLFAAIHGLGALPGAFVFVPELFPQSQRGGDGGSGGDGGGSSGCGGGGGGGCGGCGG